MVNANGDSVVFTLVVTLGLKSRVSVALKLFAKIGISLVNLS